MLKWIIFSILYLTSFVGCTIVEVSEGGSETPLQAVSEKIFHAPVVLKSSFPPSREKSYYAIQISDPGFYSISVSASRGWNLRLFLLDNALELLAAADDGYQNQGENLPLIYLEKRLYYVLIEHKYNLNSSTHSNKSPGYSLLVQNFAASSMSSPFQLARQVIPSLDNIQVIKPQIPIYGFFTPANSPFMSSHLLQNFAARIVHLAGMPMHPYHLALYTFTAPDKNSNISMTLSAPAKSNAIMVLLETADFSTLLQQSRIAPQLEFLKSLSIAKYENRGNGKSIKNYQLIQKKQYILALLGFQLTELSSFLEVQRNPYKVLMTISEN